TTLTEHILLAGGAVRAAGAGRARGEARRSRSDWMKIEKERGISVSASVMTFEHDGKMFNLLDTPGHEDFSEDTYRTLTAADCAIMILDAAKGVEPQTRKLFHVCRMRKIPIVTFVNKLDRPARDPFELMSQVEDVLGIHTCPFTWPIGSGDLFPGVFASRRRLSLRFEQGVGGNAKKAISHVSGIDDPGLEELIGEQPSTDLRNEIELLDGAGETWDEERFLAGELTPVFFGSALTNFGVEPFLSAFKGLCPAPGPREIAGGNVVRPEDDRFSAFVFKVQAKIGRASCR